MEMYSYRRQKQKWQMSNIYFENRFNKPQLNFKISLDVIKKKYKKNNIKLLDVGAAECAFAYYLKKNSQNIDVTNLEYDKKLVNFSKKKFPDYKIIHGDINKCKKIKSSYFDTITCLGVISIFDDFRPSINEMLRICKPKGLIIINNMWNAYPIDLNIKIRRSVPVKKDNFKNWESGWNMLSISTISNFLHTSKSVKKFEFFDWYMNVDLKKNKKNLMRAWTVKNKNKKRVHFNGIGRVIDKKFLVIEKK